MGIIHISIIYTGIPMDNFTQFIINHWALFLALVVLLILIFANESHAASNDEQLSPQQAVGAINHENAVLFDIRAKDRFKEGHIVDSINADAQSFDKPHMEKYKNKPLVLICANGQQSTKLAHQLKKQGFKHAKTLKGGITAWKGANLPLTQTASKKQAVAASAAND